MISKAHRYREILEVLAKHGIGIVDDELIRHQAGDRAKAVHLRQACEELGPLFIKFGQALSTRGDLLSDVYRTELAKLQDEVAPLSSAEIAGVIQAELGAPPEKLFGSFDPKPLGSASIGQVHRAKLSDGREVVVKVRKPGVDELVHIDLEILSALIDHWSDRFPALVRYDARGVLRDFSDVLLAELDYSREAANILFFREVFANERGFRIPEVFGQYSKNRVLTEALVTGRKSSDIGGLLKPIRALASQRIARFVLEPAFEHGVFYADPHSGNLLIGEDGSVSFFDFGKVGHLSSAARRRAADLFIAIARSDAQRLVDCLIQITAPTHPLDRDAIVREVDRILEEYVDVSLENLRFGDAIAALLELIRNNRLRLPGAMVQFFKALAMCEGVLQTIAPDQSFPSYLQPMIGKLAYQAFAGPGFLGRLRDSAVDAAELSIGLPRRIDRVLDKIERGNIRVWTQVEGLEPLVSRLEHSVARASASVLAAACIIALAVVMQFYQPHGWQRWIGIVFWLAVTLVIINYVRTLLNLRK